NKFPKTIDTLHYVPLHDVTKIIVNKITLLPLETQLTIHPKQTTTKIRKNICLAHFSSDCSSCSFSSLILIKIHQRNPPISDKSVYLIFFYKCLMTFIILQELNDLVGFVVV